MIMYINKICHPEEPDKGVSKDADPGLSIFSPERSVGSIGVMTGN